MTPGVWRDPGRLIDKSRMCQSIKPVQETQDKGHSGPTRKTANMGETSYNHTPTYNSFRACSDGTSICELVRLLLA